MKIPCKIALASLAAVSLLSACSPDEAAVTASTAVTAARVAHAVKSDTTPAVAPHSQTASAPGQPISITLQCTSVEDCQKKVDSLKEQDHAAAQAVESHPANNQEITPSKPAQTNDAHGPNVEKRSAPPAELSKGEEVMGHVIKLGILSVL